MRYNKLTFHVAMALSCWSDPIRMQMMFNSLATNYPGDTYALVQRQAALEKES